MTDCVFCDVQDRILNGDKNFTVIDSLYPVIEKGHLLVIPKEHISGKNFYEIKSQSYFDWINYGIATLQERGFTSFNVGWNLGIDAGQTIKHMHCHIIGRKEGDVENPRGGIRNIIPGKGNY